MILAFNSLPQMKDELRNHLQLCYRPRMFPQVKLSLNVENNCRSRSPHNVPKKIESSHKNRSFTVGADATICVWFLGQIAVHKSQTYTHRRRIYTETKAKSRCFCMFGGQDRIPHWDFNVNVRYCVHSCCTFPFTFVGGRGKGDVLCRFVIQV